MHPTVEVNEVSLLDEDWGESDNTGLLQCEQSPEVSSGVLNLTDDEKAELESVQSLDKVGCEHECGLIIGVYQVFRRGKFRTEFTLSGSKYITVTTSIYSDFHISE